MFRKVCRASVASICPANVYLLLLGILVHHRSTNPSPWAAYSFHPVEAVVEAGIFVVIVFTIPAHGLALFAFLLYMIVRNVLGHLGIEFLPKNFLHNHWLRWHTTTTHHDLHHKCFDHN